MTFEELSKYFTIINILASIGVFTIVLSFFEKLFKVIPQLDKFRSDFWRLASRKWKHKILEKKAIASEIESVVNETITGLQNELPNGWVPRATIKWVDYDIKEEDLIEGETILRIRPAENQDVNLINGIYYFFTKSLFPGTKEIIPQNIRKAVTLQILRRTIFDKKPFLSDKFEKGILESAVKSDSSIVGFIEKCENIDGKGFFTGSFLREIHEIASRSQFKNLRNRIEEEINGVLDHVKGFVDNIHKESIWFRKGPATSYGFLLVAQPLHGGVEPYIKRIKKCLEKGIERIYVMGTSQEIKFVEKVISAIAKLPECRLVEIFKLHRDYRGDRDGIGALFVKGGYDNKTEKEIDKFFKQENNQ